jgi:hypothetical protein
MTDEDLITLWLIHDMDILNIVVFFLTTITPWRGVRSIID